MTINLNRIPRGRPRLAAVLQKAGQFIGVDDVITVFDVNRKEGAKILSGWNAQGWIKRVKRGVYIPIPLDSQPTGQILADPWILIPKMFGNAYGRMERCRILGID